MATNLINQSHTGKARIAVPATPSSSTKAIAAKLEQRDKLAARLAKMDTEISSAGREWGKANGFVFPLRDEALRREIARALKKA